jgi:protein tyrosine phosphatase (PTP) superfamily phosphohydrolase (DUF442 family)
MRLKVFVLSILTACAACAAAATQEAAQSAAGGQGQPDIPFYREVTPLIATAGQPTAAGLKALAEKGFKTVVNLRTPDENGSLPKEEQLARDLGLRYFNIPVAGKAPEEKQAAEFLRLMDELKDERVVVHCATANRVGAFIMIERVMRAGWAVDRAEEEAGKIGLRSDLLRVFARQYIEKNSR